MKKYCVFCDSMIGNVYPFYLNNSDLKSNYYLYQITSPGLDVDCVPTLSLAKISERFSAKDNKEQQGKYYCATKNNMMSSDLLSALIHSRKDVKTKGVELLSNILSREEVDVWSDNNKDFPLIEMKATNSVQKALVLGLRDAIRWKFYSFSAGNKVDIIVDKKHFIVFDIADAGDNNIKLVPQAMYELADANLSNPMEIPSDMKLDICNKTWGGDKRASDINRDIRRIEKNSLD